MEEELNDIALQPVETQNLASPDQPVQEVQPIQEAQEVQPVQESQESQPLKKDTRKRYPWYYVKRFDRYIIKKFLGTFFFAILLLFAIVVVFDINEKLDAVLTAPLAATVFQYFMNFLPFVLSQFSPLFTFIAVIFFTSRLADRSEIIAMLSNGISFHRLTLPYLFSAAVIAVGSYLLAAYIIPPANIERIAYQNKWVKNKEVVYGDNIQLQVKPGVMAYMARYDNSTRSGFRFSLEEFEGNTLKSRLTAETIKYDSVGLWTVRNYTIRTFKGMKETMTKGAVMDTLLNIDPATSSSPRTTSRP